MRFSQRWIWRASTSGKQVASKAKLHAVFLLCLFFHSEVRGDMFLWNVSIRCYILDDRTLQICISPQKIVEECCCNRVWTASAPFQWNSIKHFMRGAIHVFECRAHDNVECGWLCCTCSSWCIVMWDKYQESRLFLEEVCEADLHIDYDPLYRSYTLYELTGIGLNLHVEWRLVI